MSGVAVLFPGQGSQEVGMGADLFERHPEILGTTSDRILGWSRREVCVDGPNLVLEGPAVCVFTTDWFRDGSE